MQSRARVIEWYNLVPGIFFQTLDNHSTRLMLVIIFILPDGVSVNFLYKFLLTPISSSNCS